MDGNLGSSPSMTLVVNDAESLNTAISAVNGQSIVAVDCEGVDLSRVGQLSLIQVGTKDGQCFLFDVLEKPPTLIAFLKVVMEDSSILKIIHDCRMDSDALYHLFGIRLTNVFDTQCWQTSAGQMQKSLNDTLLVYGLQANIIRDSSMYKTNHAFWVQRPLTKTMIEWASGDIAKLFDLSDRQQSTEPHIAKRALRLAEDYVNTARDSVAQRVIIPTVVIPRLIGSKGTNIRNLQEKFELLMYHRGDRTKGEYVVYTKDEAAMQRAVQMLASEYGAAISCADASSPKVHV